MRFVPQKGNSVKQRMSRARFEQEATVKGRNEATLNVKNHEMQVRYITPQTAPRLQDCFSWACACQNFELNVTSPV